MRRKFSRLSLVLACVVILSAGTVALAWPFFPFPFPVPVPVPEPCPNPDWYCLDVWDPVTCDNGVTYSNQCYADRACAKNCVEGYPSQ